MLKSVGTVLLALLALAMLIFTVNDYLNTPTVFTSYGTGRCVSIALGSGETVSCDRLPSLGKYENVWVE